ncbi:asparagine synthase B [Oscillibacter sp. MSJ-2]|uniref:asparagine synthase (glutamine-hydrolyzing) n=1 Tax=Dysosmobacter acutus TaxID=2841504 RepID=A0ABS6F6Q9_9FIRM|nr:asparagine synthase B [Dysosmobacter acutus]MBU5625965.1 asparagine synthase B [Dysosmobacter acutus]
MCSIMGFSKKTVGREEIREYFDRTKSRGPDMSRVVETKSGYLCFHRLAIMGLEETGMQPFELEGDMVVCNGELYNWRGQKEKLEEHYQFWSGSDCELLLPMYREYGLSMFSRLDAEFALILYDSMTDTLVAARDPIGIRPLFYGYDSGDAIVFASEAKNLVGLCREIRPFPPGHYYAFGRFVRYMDLTTVREYCEDDLETVCANIREKLVAGVKKRLDADAPLGFLLSGGLDSSLVCAISAKLLHKPIRTFAIGMDKDAIDLKYAREVADYIGADHTEVYMTRDQVISSLEEVIAMLGTYDITTIRASMGMYLCCKAIHERSDIRVLMTGEISDELFGYKYTDFAPSPEAFQQEAKKRIDEIYMYDVLRADRCISVNSLEARVPFGDLEFVRYVMSVDPAKKMNVYHKGKYLLRRAFEGDLLPRDILYREKAAFSDAVGHSMVDDLKEYAEAVYSDEDYEKKRKKYGFAIPFTKESLLYREIFERYYPGQARMVKDFWMPNRSWKGCDVNDPSARVLANYGGSGE